MSWWKPEGNTVDPGRMDGGCGTSWSPPTFLTGTGTGATFRDLPFTARVLALFQPHSHTGLSREGMFHRNMGGCTLNTTFETAVGIRGLVLTRGQS